MRNMTITVDEETAEWARIHAAQNRTSVSRMVGMMLAEKKLEEECYASRMENYLTGSARPFTAAQPVQDPPDPTRDTWHER